MFKEIHSYLFATIYRDGHCNLVGNDWDSIDKLINEVKKENIQILEIGANAGHSTCLLGLWAKQLNGKVFTIEPITSPELFNCFNKNIQHFQIQNYVELIRGYSYNVVGRFTDNYFDFIFIDGNHAYNEIKKDITLYYPKLKSGGIMCGHDCELFVSKEGIANIFKVNYKPIVQPFIDGCRTLYGHNTVIPMEDNGDFDIKKIDCWETRDIIGLYYNRASQCPVLGVHPGAVLAVSEIFGDKAQILGDRIWWIKKP